MSSPARGEAEEWLSYGNYPSQQAPFFDDRLLYNQRLRDHETRLFSDSDSVVEVILYLRAEAGGCVEILHIRDIEALEALFQRIANSCLEAFFIFRQPCSWGRFNLTSKMFKQILGRIDVFPPFLDLILGFGFKLEPRDEHFGGLYGRIYDNGGQSTEDLPSSFELAYNLRYVERHGRNLKDPWSIRQSAVYQKYNAERGCSSWIIIQPSDTMYRHLKVILNDGQYFAFSQQNRTILHSAALGSGERNWREYINYLEQECSILEEKALLSHVGRRSEVDYRIAFADTQELQALCKKMQKCRAILDTSLNVAADYEAFWLRLSGATFLSKAYAGGPSTHVYKSLLCNHRRGVQTLLDASAGVSKILFQILQHRNDEILIQLNHAQQRTSESAKSIAEAAKEENRTAAMVLTASQADSQVIKILTYVAMVYLPASLIASVFNSNLVETSNAENSATGMRLAKGFWVYPLITLALLAVTLASSMAWVRFRRGSWSREKLAAISEESL